MSSSLYGCAFCDAKLPSKNELREHFRTHTNLTNEGAKKSSMNITPKVETSARKLVPCDVCSEEFDTVTKAISHKFKKHPDTPNNHFCPWCGKQFPIKQVRDSHLQTHKETADPVFKLPCAECGTEFFTNEAVKYHCQSFHRKAHMLQLVQIPPPSNKIYLNGHGDLLSVYFCHLCGQEYVIKYNLQKHIKNVHGEQPATPPNDVVKCKTCDAIFYSVGAYEFHTTFHKPDDLYVTSEEMRKQVVTKVDQDFDFRRVKPPMRNEMGRARKIVRKPPSSKKNIGGMSSMPLSSIRPETEEAEEASLDKVSREFQNPSSNAITLDEFVNMNKDVFSECFNTKALESSDDQVKTKSGTQPLDQCDPDPAVGKIKVRDIKKLLPTVAKDSMTIKRIAVPKGVLKPGVKVMTKKELERLQKQGLISVVPKPTIPVNVNRLHVVPSAENVEPEKVKNVRTYSRPKVNNASNDVKINGMGQNSEPNNIQCDLAGSSGINENLKEGNAKPVSVN